MRALEKTSYTYPKVFVVGVMKIFAGKVRDTAPVRKNNESIFWMLKYKNKCANATF